MKRRCPTCGRFARLLYIDCELPLDSVERDRVRVCVRCTPSAGHPLAGCLPRCLVAMNLTPDVLAGALAGRRWAADRLGK